MEATIEELWLEFSQRYLDKYGERPTMSITSRDALILAILDLDTPDDPDYDIDFD
jgi:hypothetical protein